MKCENKYTTSDERALKKVFSAFFSLSSLPFDFFFRIHSPIYSNNLACVLTFLHKKKVLNVIFVSCYVSLSLKAKWKGRPGIKIFPFISLAWMWVTKRATEQEEENVDWREKQKQKKPRKISRHVPCAGLFPDNALRWHSRSMSSNSSFYATQALTFNA